MRVEVTVKPNAKHVGVAEKDGVLIVSVAAPPTGGRANEELIELLSDYFEVAKSSVEILHGTSDRTKLVEIRPWQKR